MGFIEESAVLEKVVTPFSSLVPEVASRSLSGSFVAVDGFRHTKQKNQRSIGRFYHVKLLSEARLHSEVEDGHHSMVWVPVSEVATKITWDSHRSAWNILKN